MAKKVKVLMCKGNVYYVDGNQVVVNVNDEAVRLDLEFGKSAYSTVYLYLTRKTSSKEEGVHTVGNFSYTLSEANELVVYNKAQEVIIEKVLEDKDTKYIRTTVINLLINTLE